MRIFAIILSSSIVSGAYAMDYPEPSDPVAKKAVERFKQDKAQLDSPTLFEIPDPIPAWPCEVSEEERRKIAGVGGMSSLPADVQKRMKESYRKLGMKPPKDPEYKNLQIIPIKAQCVQERLSGDIDLLVAYDSHTEDVRAITIFGKVVNNTTTTKTNTVKRIQKTIVPDNPNQAPNVISMQMITKTDTHSDDEQMEAQNKETEKLLGDKPTISRSIVYREQNNKQSSSFMLMARKQVSAGLFGLGVNAKDVSELHSTFLIPVDDQHSRSEEYINKSLTFIRNLKNHKLHGETIFNWGNYAKENNMSPGSQELIKITCYQDGEEVRMSPCPSE